MFVCYWGNYADEEAHNYCNIFVINAVRCVAEESRLSREPCNQLLQRFPPEKHILMPKKQIWAGNRVLDRVQEQLSSFRPHALRRYRCLGPKGVNASRQRHVADARVANASLGAMFYVLRPLVEGKTLIEARSWVVSPPPKRRVPVLQPRRCQDNPW